MDIDGMGSWVRPDVRGTLHPLVQRGADGAQPQDEMGLTNNIIRAYGYVEVGDTMESINTPKCNDNSSTGPKTEGLTNNECNDSINSTPLNFTGEF